MMYMMDYYGYGGLGWFGWIFMLLWWVVVLVVGVALVKLAIGGRGNRRDGKTAMDVLKERYAKGEITKKSFTEMKRELEK